MNARRISLSLRLIASLIALLSYSALSQAASAAEAVRQSAREIPVAATTDVLVVGGSSAAVEAAVAAAKGGAKVFLMAPRHYLGQDLAGTLRLWLEPGEAPETDLCRKVFAEEGLVTNTKKYHSLKFSYLADLPAASRHADTQTPSKLADGRAADPSRESVQYDGDVTVTADMGPAMGPVLKEARIIIFQRPGDYQAASVAIETSLDGKKWKPVDTVPCPASAFANVGAPVGEKVRMVRFRVKRAPKATRLLLGEILLLPIETAATAPPKPTATAAGPIRPMHVKKTLDDALTEAGVEFLFGCYPTDLLRDGAGNLCGVVMANRSGRQAVLAKTIIDASEHATVARLAGAEFSGPNSGPCKLQWITIGEKPREGEGLSARRLDLPVAVYDKKGEAIVTKPAAWFEYSMTLNQDRAADDWGARAALENKARDLCFDPAQYYSADSPFIIPIASIKSAQPQAGPWPTASKLDLGAFRPAAIKNLWVLSGYADLPREQAATLLRPAAFMKAGERVGRAAAEEAKKIDTPAGVKVESPSSLAPRPSSFAINEPLDGMRPSPNPQHVSQPESALPVLGTYDVVVVGGGTAGAPAGIGAARRGAKTLVLEYLHGLGGVGTLGMIGAYYHGNKVGFTATVPEGPTDARMEWYRGELRKAGADVWFEAMGCGAVMDGNRVAGVVVATPLGRGVVLAKNVVDATGNSDIAIAGGAASVFVEDDFAVQNSHVPLREVGAWYMNGNIPATSDADPFHVRQALTARRENTFDRGQAMASRERRRVVGDFTIDWLDVFNTRTFPDSITLSKSNYDSHGYQIHPYFMLRSFNYRAETNTGYAGFTPYRCLLPRGVEGILVAGLGMSAHRDAMPILRMQPDLHNQGYAAGYAAAMAAQAGVTPRQVDVKELQKHLVEIGNLDADVVNHKDSFPMAQEKIAAAVRTLPQDFTAMGVLLAQPADALPALRQAYAQAEGPAKVAYAEALGVMGDAAGFDTLVKEAERLLAAGDAVPVAVAAPTLGGALAVEPLTRVAWALGGTRERKAVPLLCTLAGEIDAKNLWRYRAVVVSLGRLGEPAAAPTLARLLREQTEKYPDGSIAGLDTAVALYRCGDPEGLARRTLEWCVNSPNGPWSELARQVLKDKPGRVAK